MDPASTGRTGLEALFADAPPAAGPEVELGYVSGVFGVQGEVRLHLHHRESTLLADGHAVVLIDPEGQRHAAELSSRSGAGKRVLGRFGVSLTREQAAALKGWRIHVPAADLPPLEEGEFWVWQLEGAPVFVASSEGLNDPGVSVGTVVAVHRTGPVDVFELALNGTAEHVFVPGLSQHVVSAGPDGLVLAESP